VSSADDVREQRFCAETPRLMIGDKAYDSDPLDELKQAYGAELAAPHNVLCE